MNQENTMPNAAAPDHNDIGNAIVPALISALFVCIVRFFTIPWSIWKGAALRLADMRKHKQSVRDNATRSEFPVFDWFRASWDGVIFLSWFGGVIVTLLFTAFTAFALASSPYGNFGMGPVLWMLISGLIYTYFSVIAMSLFKESLILVLSIALNMEKLANAKSGR